MLGINDDPVTIKNIELSIVERAFEEGWIRADAAGDADREARRVVGSGPAGLAAADQLNKAGHLVTVFEKSDRIGGLLRYGIPEFKIEKRLLDPPARRCSKQEGVRVPRRRERRRRSSRSQTCAREFDAIVLCGGAGWRRAICRFRAASSQGIHFAVDYLTQQNRLCEGDEVPEDPLISAAGKRVVIIGGGDTGADCLGTAHRQGALSVHQFELLPRPPESRAAGQSLAAVAAHLPDLGGARRGRRAAVLDLHRAIPGRRRRAACGRWRPSNVEVVALRHHQARRAPR